MDNNFKGRSQNVLVKCSDIMSSHNAKFAGHYSKFGRKMSVDRLLFPTLLQEEIHLLHVALTILASMHPKLHMSRE